MCPFKCPFTWNIISIKCHTNGISIFWQNKYWPIFCSHKCWTSSLKTTYISKHTYIHIRFWCTLVCVTVVLDYVLPFFNCQKVYYFFMFILSHIRFVVHSHVRLACQSVCLSLAVGLHVLCMSACLFDGGVFATFFFIFVYFSLLLFFSSWLLSHSQAIIFVFIVTIWFVKGLPVFCGGHFWSIIFFTFVHIFCVPYQFF